MRLSMTFSVYVGRQYLYWFLLVTLILVTIVLLVARASDVAVRQLFLPMILLAGLIGGLKIAVFNPLGTAMLFHLEDG